jgi:hypothetical protein
MPYLIQPLTGFTHTNGTVTSPAETFLPLVKHSIITHQRHQLACKLIVVLDDGFNVYEVPLLRYINGSDNSAALLHLLKIWLPLGPLQSADAARTTVSKPLW